MESWNGHLDDMQRLAAAALGEPPRVVERFTSVRPHKRYLDGGTDILVGYRRSMGDGTAAYVLWEYRKGCATVVPDDILPLFMPPQAAG